MSIEKLLSEKRSTILGRWFEAVIATYPPDTVQFLRRQKDAMANPVGSSTLEGLEGLLGELSQETADPIKVTYYLDRIIKIRAVQKFKPSVALVFVPQLKGLVREVFAKDIEKKGLEAELPGFDAKVDSLTLRAFDIYMACWDQLKEIKINDEKRRLHNLLRRANLLCENGEEAELPDLRDSGNEI